MPVKDIIARLQRLASERSLWEHHWQDLDDYVLAGRASFVGERMPGQKRAEKQFDGTPMQAARGLAASLDGLLRGRRGPWFAIRTANKVLGEQSEVKEWLEDSGERMADAMYNPRSRFLQRVAEVDLGLVVFGTGILFIGEDVGGRKLLFRSHHLKDCYIAENSDGDIDTLFRPFKLTARQAAQRFGAEKLGPKVQEALRSEKERDAKFLFLHAVMPSEDYPDRVTHDFVSLWIEVESEHLIATKGFHEFPYVVPRWDTAPEETYGRSPAMIALADVQTLNQMAKTILRAGHRAVEPPLAIPSSGLTSAPRTWPGGIMYFKHELLQATRGKSPIFPVETGAQLPLGLKMQQETRDMVWAAFFRNVLQLPTQGPQMTATEILQRREEFMRIIGPTFGRLEADYTGPMIERVFNVMMRAGEFAEPPEALRNTEVRFEFQSAVARIDKLVEAGAIGKTMEDLAPLLADGDLSPLDNFEKDEISRDVAEANGVPQKWLREVDERDAIRQQRAEAIAAEQEAQDAERAIEGVSKVASIVPEGV